MSTHPRRLGKYELQQRLGYGGTAEVWKALDLQLQRYVAIKLLHANLKEDPHFIERFEREARLIASLHHPNIVKIHDFQILSSEEEGTIAYMVMDYVEGQTLADYIRNTPARGNFLSAQEIVQLFTSIGLAVDYAHQQGMIHRDLKPANILLDSRNTTHSPIGEPILTDFGLARLMGAAATTLSIGLPGTPLYISPEQVSGYPGNERSDVYSLGVILYEMVTGVVPFRGDDPTSVMAQHLNATPTFPTQINPTIPAALAMVIMRCLAKDPAARFPSATSLAAAIADSLQVPVPESVSDPAFPVDAEYAPTYVTPGRSNLPTVITPSSPGISGVQTSAPMPTPVYQSSPQTPAFAVTSAVGSSAVTPPQATSQTPQLSQTSQATQITQAPPVAPTTNPVPPSAPKRPRGLFLGIIGLLIVLLGGSLGAYFLHFRAATGGTVTSASDIVGQAVYASSGQLGDGAQGIADELEVDLQNIPAPPTGKSYYLWLLGDKDTTSKPDFLVPPPFNPPLLLTNNLPVQQNGTVHYIYTNPQHNNLLSVTSRLLITLENAGQNPGQPSTDHSTWVYYAQLPQAYIPKDSSGLNLRGLDHIRHLFYNEDHLQVKGLYGGLDTWVFRDTEKILELSSSARDDFDGTTNNYQQIHSLSIEILDYLDGIPNVHLDVPAGTPVTADPTIAQIGLLEVDPNQNPPGDLVHLVLHVNELNRAPDATPQMHTLSQEIAVDITNAKVWLTQERTDAKMLFNMTPTQMTQPAARDLLNDLVTQATYAYIGKLNPVTNTIIPGVLQAHYAAQKIATYDISKNVPKSL